MRTAVATSTVFGTMTEPPDVVRRADLPFEPSFPWVYWCGACETYVNPNDTSKHNPMRANDHPSVVRLTRVDVV